MKAISLWQPWATLWLLSDPNEKVFETRHWHTRYRGELLVHAAATKNNDVIGALRHPDFIQAFCRHRLLNDGTFPAFGAIIGKIDLIDCKSVEDQCDGWSPSDREQSFGNWGPSRFVWKRGPKPVLFEKPILYKGRQGFFNVPDEIVAAALGSANDVEAAVGATKSPMHQGGMVR